MRLLSMLPPVRMGGCCDEGGAHSWGQAHVANMHIDWDAPLALHTVVAQLLRSIISIWLSCPHLHDQMNQRILVKAATAQTTIRLAYQTAMRLSMTLLLLDLGC